MRDRYTYEQIQCATHMMFVRDPCFKDEEISNRTGISISRIKEWRRLWGEIMRKPTLHIYNYETLKCISNLAYGVCQEVWGDWIDAIDERLGEINGADTIDVIRTILDEIAQTINVRYPERRDVSPEMLERTVQHIADSRRLER